MPITPCLPLSWRRRMADPPFHPAHFSPQALPLESTFCHRASTDLIAKLRPIRFSQVGRRHRYYPIDRALGRPAIAFDKRRFAQTLGYLRRTERPSDADQTCHRSNAVAAGEYLPQRTGIQAQMRHEYPFGHRPQIRSRRKIPVLKQLA
jgi:hypothetical protein